ncbi:MAG: cell envelope integrity protein CreD [Candidatus Methylacidiphilales bacterium]|nr:cell envelope integrity protein CreD [Candidatus Methylacidiphilales bacterium]
MADSSFFQSVRAFFGKFAVLFKLAVIGFLILILLIPLSMIGSVLQERLGRRNEAVAEITSSWGDSQKIIGPVLQIPYKVRSKVWRDQPQKNGTSKRVEVEVVEMALATFLPKELKVDGEILTQKLHRGIYDAVVYSGNITLSGAFSQPDWQALKIDPKEAVYEDAVVVVGVSDLRGTRGRLVLDWGGRACPMTPGTNTDLLPAGVSASVKGWLPTDQPTSFSLPVTFNGSQQVLIAPLGVESRVHLSSDWPDPGFRGAFLPTSREISAQGFTAAWDVSYYGRSFPQQWARQNEVSSATLHKSLFGVEFVSLIDFYRNVERAIKYAMLFLVLVFTAFFLFEVISKLRIHPFQYILVGAALCLFYLGLLSLSEFLRFGWAYLVAAAASWALVSLYSLSVLRSGSRTLIVAGLLALIQGLLYVVLQLQDYALLVGTIGLFLALAAVMFVTRRVDWYGGREEPVAPASPAQPPPLP